MMTWTTQWTAEGELAWDTLNEVVIMTGLGGIVIAGDEEIVNDRHSSLSLSSLLPCNH